MVEISAEEKARQFAIDEWNNPDASSHCQYSEDISRIWLAGREAGLGEAKEVAEQVNAQYEKEGVAVWRIFLGTKQTTARIIAKSIQSLMEKAQ